MEKDINSCHNRSRQLLDDARRFLIDARSAYRDVEQELSRLDTAIERLSPFVEELERENIRLRPLVDNATEHAKKLKQQADILDRFEILCVFCVIYNAASSSKVRNEKQRMFPKSGFRNLNVSFLRKRSDIRR